MFGKKDEFTQRLEMLCDEVNPDDGKPFAPRVREVEQILGKAKWRELYDAGYQVIPTDLLVNHLEDDRLVVMQRDIFAKAYQTLHEQRVSDNIFDENTIDVDTGNYL